MCALVTGVQTCALPILVSPEFAGRGVDVLAEQPRGRAPGEHLLEQDACILVAAGRVERLDQPEGADVERGVRQAEIVLGGITQHIAAAPQPFLRSENSRVGKGWVGTCRSRWSPSHQKKKT